METQLLDGLNDAQRAAVTSNASVLQILAPPGSGKTKTLTCRVAYLIAHHGYNPQNVICCTFTIKASREMRERLHGLGGSELQSKLVLGTFHSICNRYLIAYGTFIGIPKGFGVADSTDSSNIVKRIIKRLNLSIEPKTARSKISRHKARGKGWDELAQESVKNTEKQEFVTVFREYDQELAKSNLLDFDDLLLRCVDLLRKHPECVSNVEALLIDEFQDTNVVQFELMKLLACKHRRITIVGDPDQSIYGFRSAEIENLRRMKDFYPETAVINLEENYRSSSAILDLAQEVIEQDTTRPAKKLKATHCCGTLPVLRRLPNPNEEALWITSEIKRVGTMTGGLIQHSDVAILLRSAYLSLLIEKALTASGIPYRMVGGRRFFDRPEIKLIIDYLRTIGNPDNNQALQAIINVPSRKIGETTIASFLKLADDRKLSLWAVVQKVIQGEVSLERKLSKPAEYELSRLVAMIKKANNDMKNNIPANVPSRLIDIVIKSLDYETYLKKEYKDDHEERLENVKELLTHASDVSLLPVVEPLASIEGLDQSQSNGGEEMLSQFLANIVLSSDVDKSEDSHTIPRVTISTIHSAKGLEWPVVFIPAIYEGSIPHSRAEDTDEERRLFYVAMTRAQALLTMTFPLSSRDDGESALTPFLSPKILRRVAPIGPLFADEVITDIASILRRSEPSKEELVKGLQSLTDKESAADDQWPSDGSRRPFSIISEHSRSLPGIAAPLAEAVAAARFPYQQPRPVGVPRVSTISIAHFQEVSTTMNSIKTISTANMSAGFTTANCQLKIANANARESSPDLSQPKKKPKLTTTASGSGSIKSFFRLPSQSEVAGPNVVASASKPPSQFHRLASAQALTEPSSLRYGYNPIPKELCGHKLDVRNGMTKSQPAPSRETDAKTKGRYASLYSSSPPPEDEASKIEIEMTQENDGQTPRSGAIEMPRLKYVLSRPATTMHDTSMSRIQRNGVGLTGRKTLGIRRSMNGWDARRNK